MNDESQDFIVVEIKKIEKDLTIYEQPGAKYAEEFVRVQEYLDFALFARKGTQANKWVCRGYSVPSSQTANSATNLLMQPALKP